MATLLDSRMLAKVVQEGVTAETSLELRPELGEASIQCLEEEHPRSNRCETLKQE